MALIGNNTRSYQHIYSEGNSRVHLGDVYNDRQSPDERALQAILGSLSYPGMTDRRDALAEAHEQTFDWTFLEGKTRFLKKRDTDGLAELDRFENIEVNFKAWLQQENEGLFCVTGKPGSGKSTFMKMLAANNDATTILRTWAVDAVLLRSDHFFWLLGASMQKSIEGMLRSILHSVLLGLSQCETPTDFLMIRQICGARWQSATANGAWSRKELEQMLIRLSSVSRVKSFFLIDALDECEPQDHLEDLANEILWLSRLPNIKLCVSCRPWDVFTRKFACGVFLRLDQLTRRDMESYVDARLTATEMGKGWNSDFRNGTRTATRLIQNVARDAEGVFLWIELVVKAMCSEIRKGRTVERLSQIASDFPTDLDDYFHRLIFDRIERSASNVADTAAALSLVLALNASEQTRDESSPVSHPFAQSFMDFWLLSNGHLRPGFSWMDGENISQPPISRMLDQVASYLEETCKDLLVLDRATKRVDLLHRTVFDFLSDKKVHNALEQHSPSHFSGSDFVFDLARIRCVCLLQAEHENGGAVVKELDTMLREYEHIIHLEEHAAWLSRCELVTVSELQQERPLHLRCSDLPGGMARRCLKAGLRRCIPEVCRHVVHITPLWDDSYDLDPLGELLQTTCHLEIRGPDLLLFQHLLEIGYDANRDIGHWPFYWRDRHPFENSYRLDELSWCARTSWTAWLGEAYLQLQRSSQTASEPGDTTTLRKKQIGAIIDLLLRYGADPQCMVCIADHGEASTESCDLITLDQLMEDIVPPDSLTRLRNLRVLCANEAIAYALRRNQRRRATKSHLITRHFLDSFFLAHLSNVSCNECFKKQDRMLVAWCLDCGGVFSLCYSCLRLEPSDLPPPETLRGFSTRKHTTTAADDHTSVTWVRTKNVGYEFYKPFADQATSVLQKWHAKDPIEPDLSFEQVLREAFLRDPYQHVTWSPLARWLAERSESQQELTEHDTGEMCDLETQSVD